MNAEVIRSLLRSIDPDTCVDCGKHHVLRPDREPFQTWADPEDGHFYRPQSAVGNSYLDRLRDALHRIESEVSA